MMGDDRNSLFHEILKAISSRQQWEERQTLFYQMRHGGLGRKNKPYPNAPDLHFPLIDGNVDKLKPLYYQQIFGFDTAASFVPMNAQLASWTSQAERWFDYKLREKTNLQQEALTWADNILTYSSYSVMKCYWDEFKKQVVFDAVDPFKFIVPEQTQCVYDADWCVHVITHTPTSYERSPLFEKKDEDTIERITGNGKSSSHDAGSMAKDNEKYRREGITNDSNNEKIIVWEVHQFGADGIRTVSWFSPVAPDIDLKQPIQLPYYHQGPCFVESCYEVKDKGWYAPRGVPEILAPFEMSLDALWNGKHEAIDFFNRPTFMSKRDGINTSNIRARPGEVLPYGIVPVQMSQPPVSYIEEMVNTRTTAEQRIGNPDYGLSQAISTNDRRTKYEIESINSQSQQGYDLRIRLFRRALKKLYAQAWSLYLQFDKEDLQYQFLGAFQQIDQNALHDQYYIEPKGGMDMTSRQGKFNQAVQLKQIFSASPWIQMPEVDKYLINLQDPSLVPLWFQDPMLKQMEAQELAMMRLPAISMGQRLPVNPGEDYPTEINTIMVKVQEWAVTGQQLPPEGNAAIIQRLQDLVDAYQKVDNNGALELRKKIGHFFQQNHQIINMPQQQSQAVG